MNLAWWQKWSLGGATIFPLVAGFGYMAWFMTYAPTIVGNEQRFMADFYRQVLPYQLGFTLFSFALVATYVFLAVKMSESQIETIVWIAVVVLGSTIGQAVFFVMKIWPGVRTNRPMLQQTVVQQQQPAQPGWFYAQQGRPVGPVSDDGLRDLFRLNRIPADTMVWRAGMANWIPLSQVRLNASPSGPVPATPAATTARLGDDPAMRLLLPVGRSGWAIASGYCGLFALLFPPLGLPAIITGIVGIVMIRRDPHLHGMGRAIFGIAVGAFWIVILLIVLIVALVNGGGSA